jgi:hypothetical protein
MARRTLGSVMLVVAVMAGTACQQPTKPSGGSSSGPSRCSYLPADNVLRTRVDSLPVHTSSAQYVASIGAGATFHADFGSGLWNGGPIGIPINVVKGGKPSVSVRFQYASESDRGPYLVPSDVRIEGGPSSRGDRHVLVVDDDACTLYELFAAYPNGDGSWRAGSGAIFDLGSNALRPDTWTSADAAGLPMAPLLVRYDEVAAGEIKHAIRFTAPNTQSAYVWPARHEASDDANPALPPMGQRFRLKASFDTAGFSRDVQVILTAMKRYGIVLADNGSPWYIGGVPDERWDNDVLHELHRLPGSAFEAVDVSSMQVDPNSGAARQP